MEESNSNHQHDRMEFHWIWGCKDRKLINLSYAIVLCYWGGQRCGQWNQCWWMLKIIGGITDFTSLERTRPELSSGESCWGYRCPKAPCFCSQPESGQFFRCIQSSSHPDKLSQLIGTRIVLGCITHQLDGLCRGFSLDDCALSGLLGLVHLVLSTFSFLLSHLLA